MNNEYQTKPLLICRKCIKDKCQEPWGFMTYRGFYNMFKLPEDMKCKECGGTLEKTKLSCGEYDVLNKISHDSDFLLAMIDLKLQDPIEYQLKYNEFIVQTGQKEIVINQTEKLNVPKCPTCNSTNIRQITRSEQFQDMVWGGVTAPRNYKTFICNNCGYEW